MPNRKPSQASLFAALGDEMRLRIVARLSDRGPQSIAGLTKGSRITRQAVSKHLRVMERSGLVHHSRNGRESVWELEHRSLDEARRYLDSISKQWDDRLLRLRRLVE